MKLEIVVLAVILLFASSLAYVSLTGNHNWGSTDDQSKNFIQDLTGGVYMPWFHSIWGSPSKEVESLLFALQAGVGGLIIGYFLGYYRASAKMKAAGDAAEDQEGKSNARPSR